MTRLLSILCTLLLSTIAFAELEHDVARVFTGWVDPSMSVFGAFVKKDTGQVLYVGSLISVLAPKDLKTDCWYAISYIPDGPVQSMIKIVPPMYELSCGHDFSRDK